MGKYSKRKKSHFVTDKMKSTEKVNPFEIRMNKQKNNVLGRKKKYDRGLPGIARNKAFKKRQVTILQEYLSKNKSNKFVDRRIGEKVPAFNKEDKMMARFSKEMKKRFKKSAMYNLNEDEELTHLGRKIGDVSKFDEAASDSDDEGQLDSQFVQNVHFGGFNNDDVDDARKTHKERMDELISESKRRKYEKKFENEANLDLTEKLDEEWKKVANIVQKNVKRDAVAGKDVDDYDMKVRELKFEAKARPSDRLKSVEETAAEERKKFQRLEEERIKRMQGDSSVGAKNISTNHISADDLCDGFALYEGSVAKETNEVDTPDDSEKEEDEQPDDSDENVNYNEKEEDKQIDDTDESDNYSDVLLDEASIGT